jgi:hypothetical protein
MPVYDCTRYGNGSLGDKSELGLVSADSLTVWSDSLRPPARPEAPARPGQERRAVEPELYH